MQTQHGEGAGTASIKSSTNVLQKKDIPGYVIKAEYELRKAATTLTARRLRALATLLRNAVKEGQLNKTIHQLLPEYIEERLRIAADEFNKRQTAEGQPFKTLEISEYKPQGVPYEVRDKWTEHATHWTRCTGQALAKSTIGKTIMAEVRRLENEPQQPHKLRASINARAALLTINGNSAELFTDWGTWVANCNTPRVQRKKYRAKTGRYSGMDDC